MSRRTVRRKLPPKPRSAPRRSSPAPSPPAVPRVARLLALAHYFDQMLHRGEVESYAELARLGHVSRARISQIMRLLDLSPTIQEQFLFLLYVASGDPMPERQLRLVLAGSDWTVQCDLWKTLARPTARTR